MAPCRTVEHSFLIVLLPLEVNTVVWSWISMRVNPTRFTPIPLPSPRSTD